MVADGIYHVTARGNDGVGIFGDDVDRVAYLELLAEAKRILTFGIFAYVLMSNHVHIVLQTPQPNIAEIMHRVHRTYAFRFNRRYKRTGHLFGGRYRSRLVFEDTDLLGVTRYVHRNPVRAGLTLNAGDYHWSSYREYVDPVGNDLVDPTPVLSIISNDASRSRVVYADLVAAGD